MKLRKTWAALLLLLCLGLLGKSGLLAADKTVPVTVKIKAGKGVAALYPLDKNNKPDLKNPLLEFQNVKEQEKGYAAEGTAEVKVKTYFMLSVLPDDDSFPAYDLYKVERVVSEEGKEDKRELVTMKKSKYSSLYTTPAYGFKGDTQITKVVYEVTFTDAIDVTFNTPDKQDGDLMLTYDVKKKDNSTETKTLTESGKIPLVVEFLNISLTSKRVTHKPEVKYTSQGGAERIVELTLEKGKWTGEIPLYGVLELNIDIRYVLNDVLIAFDTPPAEKGTVKVTYMKDGVLKELTSGTLVPINTELSVEVTKAQANFLLEVSSQKEESEEKTKVEMTANGAIYTGKVTADANLRLFFSFYKTVPVTVKIMGGKGVAALYTRDQNGKPDTKNPLLTIQNVEEQGKKDEGSVDVKELTLFALTVTPYEKDFPAYALYRVVRVVFKAGKEDKRELFPMTKDTQSNSYTSNYHGFREDTEVTQVFYEVIFTDVLSVTFNTPDKQDGELTLTYDVKQKDKPTETKTLTESGKIPLGVEFLNVSLTSKKQTLKPEVKYSAQGVTKKLNLKLENGKWTGKIPLEGVLKLDIAIRYVANDVRITFDAPPADKGTVKVTYMKDGVAKELTSGTRVPINTELSVEVTKAQTNASLDVSVQKEGATKTKVEMTAHGATYTGKVIANKSLKLFFRFEASANNPGSPSNPSTPNNPSTPQKPGTAVEDALLAAVTVAPNPFDAQLVISNIAQQGVKYTLLNTNGACVLVGEITGEFEALETSLLPLGLYLLQLTTPDGATRLLRVVKR